MEPALVAADLADWLHPAPWLRLFGVFATAGVIAIIFAETGLLFGCVLPGDSLLFTAGVLTAVTHVDGQEFQPLSLPWLLAGGPVAAILGAQLGHWLGARYGRRLFDRPDSRFFKREYVERAEYHFERFGPGRAIVVARFIPIVRTFVNPLAGMAGMSGRRFLVWNAAGAVVWTDSLFLLGHFVGARVPEVERFIMPGVAVIVALMLVPVLREVVRGRRAGRRARARGRGGARTSEQTGEPDGDRAADRAAKGDRAAADGNGPNKNVSEESRPSLSGDSYR